MNCDRYGPIDDNNDAEIIPSSSNVSNIDYIKLQSILKVSRINVSQASLIGDVKQIDKDLDRTGYLIELEADKSLSDSERRSIRTALRNVLVTFAAFNQSVVEVDQEQENKSSNLGYTQG